MKWGDGALSLALLLWMGAHTGRWTLAASLFCAAWLLNGIEAWVKGQRS